VDGAQGGAISSDLPPAWPSARSARLGGADRYRLYSAEAPTAASASCLRTRPHKAQKKLDRAVKAERLKHPQATVEIWTVDEHRIGLKPLVRRIWAPKGERPIAFGQHRFEWLYVTGFVEPASGKTIWNVATAISKAMFEAILADFAKNAGAGLTKRIVLQLDNAGWHGPENLNIPAGIRLVFQPPHSPELQPAEHLWEFLDEPLANHNFESLDELDKTVSNRCIALASQHEAIRNSTLFHWWPIRPQKN
jgi:hypothetical protein